MSEYGKDILKGVFDKYRDLTIDPESFRKYLDIYSEFLTGIDRDFQYNQSFLREYLDDLYFFRKKLLRKELIYDLVFQKCEAIRNDYRVELDGTFSKVCMEKDGEENVYYEVSGILDRNKIEKDKVYIYLEMKEEKRYSIRSGEYELSEKESDDMAAIGIIGKVLRESDITEKKEEESTIDGKQNEAV